MAKEKAGLSQVRAESLYHCWRGIIGSTEHRRLAIFVFIDDTSDPEKGQGRHRQLKRCWTDSARCSGRILLPAPNTKCRRYSSQIADNAFGWEDFIQSFRRRCSLPRSCCSSAQLVEKARPSNRLHLPSKSSITLAPGILRQANSSLHPHAVQEHRGLRDADWAAKRPRP